jgi:hypothetical protein
VEGQLQTPGTVSLLVVGPTRPEIDLFFAILYGVTSYVRRIALYLYSSRSAQTDPRVKMVPKTGICSGRAGNGDGMRALSCPCQPKVR